MKSTKMHYNNINLVSFLLTVCVLLSGCRIEIVTSSPTPTETDLLFEIPEETQSQDVNEKQIETYPNLSFEGFETFTSVTGIELNITKDAPESNGIIYNYIMDNDAAGLGAITKYETYIVDYGFEYSEALSSEGSKTYIKNGVILVTGSFYIEESNALQYVIFVQSG